jgi:threonine synthase
MRYVSTRGGMAPQSFTQILLGGLCPDGGLAVPERYPQVDAAELAAWRKLSYAELAYEVMRKFCDDIPPDDLRALCAKTYTKEAFRSEAITPVKTLEPGLHILCLSNGPTLAFKDMAMPLLGNLFEYVLAKSGERINILGATS